MGVTCMTNDKMAEIRKTRIDLEDRINILEENNKQLLDSNTQLKKYKLNDYNEKYIGEKLEKFYDVVINIKSISDLSVKDEGWPIKWNENIKSTQELLKSEAKLLKVGILGNGNIGKSFLLSRLFKEDIPSGFSVITEGLSLKINKNNSYLLFDSAGLQTPLLLKGNNNEISNLTDNDNNEEYTNLFRDKTQTENFIQNLVLSLSEMLIIVVGKLTFNEQRLINKIKNKLNNLKSKKPIFIVHNLFNYQTKEQVEEYINETLMKSVSFKIKKLDNVKIKDDKDDRRIYYVENDNSFKIYHLLTAREGTKGGDYYNEYTYEFLRGRFIEFTDRTPLSILDEIKNKFVEWSGDLLEEKIAYENIVIIKENDIEKRFIYEEIPSTNKDKNNPKKNKIIPKACLSDELGVSFYRSSGYEPSYTCYIDNEKNIYVVKIEVPGKVTIEEAFADTTKNAIIIRGVKNDENEEEITSEGNKNKDKLKNIIKNTRIFGKFNLYIPYPNEVKFADENPIETEKNINDANKNGIYIRTFRLITKRKK
jgi:hypothetical protein